MEDRVGEFFFQNGIRKSFSVNIPDTGRSTHRLYEVLRVISGIPLFMEEHLGRLNLSVRALGYNIDTLLDQAKENLIGLISANNIIEGNVILICALKKNQFDIIAYAIPHKYPTDTDYQSGVNLATCHLFRPDPNLKQVSVSDQIRDSLIDRIKKENLYEVLLVNQQECITEGSRSNFFLVKDKILYTAPDEEVLKGITRKYVQRLAQLAGIEIVYQDLPLAGIGDYDAAFICGTSPKILPVKMINEIPFDNTNRTVLKLIDLYQNEIEEYINSRL